MCLAIATSPGFVLGAVQATEQTTDFLAWLLLLLLGCATGLVLYCIFTIYRNPYFNEVQKVGWLLLALCLPIFGPLAWLIRAGAEKKHRQADLAGSERQQQGQVSSEAASLNQARTVQESAADLPPVRDPFKETNQQTEHGSFLVPGPDGRRGLRF